MTRAGTVGLMSGQAMNRYAKSREDFGTCAIRNSI